MMNDEDGATLGVQNNGGGATPHNTTSERRDAEAEVSSPQRGSTNRGQKKQHKGTASEWHYRYILDVYIVWVRFNFEI